MHRGLLLSIFIIGQLFFVHAQADCFTKLEKAFLERGANPVPDAMHKNVVICFFNKERMGCYCGKVRVEKGKITSVFLQYSDDSYVLYEDPFHNAVKTAPTIKNGISEMIYSAKGESFKIAFMDQLKPKTSGQIMKISSIFSSTLCALPLENNPTSYSTIPCLHLVQGVGVQLANKNLIFTSFTERTWSTINHQSINKTTLI